MLVRFQDAQTGRANLGARVSGPFGERTLVYADFTATGVALAQVEQYVSSNVLPWYGNTHSEAAGARMMAQLREEARARIAEHLGATADHAVIFTGSGATAAITQFSKLIGISGNAVSTQRDRPVVFVGPFEHHSNDLPWRESGATVVRVRSHRGRGPDLQELSDRLAEYSHRPLRLGAFSAASNVTGVRSDIDAVTDVLRAHGALVAWDHAASAPHTRIDVGGCDGAFISTHKFLGGPQTPGILVVRGSVVTTDVPTTPGGGTVKFVSSQRHRYTDDLVQREEAGTPAIIGAIRAGLVFDIHSQLAPQIEKREASITAHVLARLGSFPEVELLGPPDVSRLPVFSFLVRRGSLQLHHNLVVALLSDLFGIQARGGCSCAGPYGFELLGITDEAGAQFEEQIVLGRDGVKPGWTRVSMSGIQTDAEIDYVLESIGLVARHGWKLARRYRFDVATGVWQHRESARRTYSPAPEITRLRAESDYATQLELGRQILVNAPSRPHVQASVAPGFDEIAGTFLPEESIARPGQPAAE